MSSSLTVSVGPALGDCSWISSVIFFHSPALTILTEPIGVGYSYADEGEVNNSPAAAEDVYAFLMLFISQVSRYMQFLGSGT